MRHTGLMMLVGLTLSLGGCATTGPRTLTAADSGTGVSMKVGQTLTVSLPANRTTGYSWHAAGHITGVLSLEGQPVYHANPEATGRMGAGGKTTWTYRAISPGEARIRMEYRRPFEDDIAPARQFEATVEVTK